MYGNQKVIALCISKAGDERHFEFIEALNRAAVGRGFRLLVYQACSDLYGQAGDSEGDKAVLRLIDFSVTDILVIFDEAFRDKTVVEWIASAAADERVPVISVGEAKKGFVSFVFDYEKGFEQLIRHVVSEHGVTNLCLIAGAEDEACSERKICIYKRVLSEYGIAFHSGRIFYGDYWRRPAQEAVWEMVESGDIPQAILCTDDRMAITVCEELKKHGYSVPEDIIVTGFGGTWEAMCGKPSVTTCRCGYESLAESLADAAERILDGRQGEAVFSVEYCLDVYRSCGCSGMESCRGGAERQRRAENRFGKYRNGEFSFGEMRKTVNGTESLWVLIEYLDRIHMDHTYIIVNNDCFDEKVNPTVSTRSQSYDELMQIFYASDSCPANFPKTICREDVLPMVADCVDRERPLFFSALSFMGIPMGFVCFGFELSIANYCKIVQYVSTLENAIGNYRLTKYLEEIGKSRI